MSLTIGVDVGGTFTDVFVLNDGHPYRAKSDTTHYDLKVGFFEALDAAARQFGSDIETTLGGAETIVYSTTIGTNALIERKGSTLGLIATRGFEDTMHIGRSRNWGDGMQPEVKYDRGRAQRPLPLIPRERIVGISERIDNLGRVVRPMTDEDVLEQVQLLVDQNVRGFVVALLNSYVNPDHERRVRDLIRKEYPEPYLGHMPVYLSSEISPQIGEYRRTMTVVLDAYLRELTEEHLLRLVEDLRDRGYEGPVLVAKNTGGSSSLSRSQALHLYGSGPAATVVGADYVGRLIDRPNVLISDMGGTSFDVGIAVEGRDRVYALDPVVHRYRVQLPIVAHWSIGAGGGSIAHVDNGVLGVGPQSAGSNPGPACYARGGELPTVTDADVVLGYIDPHYFLGGKVRLDAERARRAVETHVATPLGVSVEEAAWSIKKLVDGYMGQEMYRICALISGQDPRDFTLFALGGAGAVHAAGYAAYTDIREIATFTFSSVFGAFSSLNLDIVQAYEKTIELTLLTPRGDYVTDSVKPFNDEVAQLLALAERDMLEEGFELANVQLQLEVHLRYGQQRQHIAISLSPMTITGEDDIRELCHRFNAAYGETYGKGAVYPEAGIDVIKVRLHATSPKPEFEFSVSVPNGDSTPAMKSNRMVFWGMDTGYVETPVFTREELAVGSIVDGPALCESVDTVIVVPSEWRYRVDERQIGWLERI